MLLYFDFLDSNYIIIITKTMQCLNYERGKPIKFDALCLVKRKEKLKQKRLYSIILNIYINIISYGGII
jgi:hypothetical protein